MLCILRAHVVVAFCNVRHKRWLRQDTWLRTAQLKGVDDAWVSFRLLSMASIEDLPVLAEYPQEKTLSGVCAPQSTEPASLRLLGQAERVSGSDPALTRRCEVFYAFRNQGARLNSAQWAMCLLRPQLCRISKFKQKFAMTDVRKEANRMGFHSMADEYSDTAMGLDFGMLGEGCVVPSCSLFLSLLLAVRSASGLA